MTLSSKAAIYAGVGDRVAIETITIDPPRTGEVLVKIRASGVCGSDRHVIDGEWTVPSPTVMGHEGAGVVAAVGPDVTEVAVGDHVILVWNQACGKCLACQSGKPWACTDLTSNDCVMPDGTTRVHCHDHNAFAYLAVGSMAEYVVVPASAAIKVPDELPFEVGALIGCAVGTGVGAVLNSGKVVAGEAAVVVGCGGVGLAIIMGLRLAGATPIIAIDLNQDKLDRAMEMGATHGLLAGSERNLVAEVSNMTGGGADIAFEAIGKPRTIATVGDYLRPGGRAILVGMPPEGTGVTFDVLSLCYRGITIVACNYGGGVPARDFPRYARLFLDGRLPIDKMIGRRIQLDDVNEAFDAMRKGADARTVILFDE